MQLPVNIDTPQARPQLVKDVAQIGAIGTPLASRTASTLVADGGKRASEQPNLVSDQQGTPSSNITKGGVTTNASGKNGNTTKSANVDPSMKRHGAKTAAGSDNAPYPVHEV